MTDYDPRADYDASWRHGNSLIRERRIRAGEVEPRPDNQEELRWAEEGRRERGGQS